MAKIATPYESVEAKLLRERIARRQGNREYLLAILAARDDRIARRLGNGLNRLESVVLADERILRLVWLSWGD